MLRRYEHLSAEERGVIIAMKLQDSSAITRELRHNGYEAQSEVGSLWPRDSGGVGARRVRHLARPARKLSLLAALCVAYGALYARVARAVRHAAHAPRGTVGQGRGARRPRTRGADRRGSLQELTSIHVRPPEASDLVKMGGASAGRARKGYEPAIAPWTPRCARR